jgi:hypothetical protein
MTDVTGGEVTVVVDVDYWQFYLKDAASGWESDTFDESDFADHLGVRSGFIYVGSGRHFGNVRVRILVLDHEPGPPPAHWQHTAEVSVVSTGELEVYGWWSQGPAATVHVPAGPLRLRVGWEGVVPFEYTDEFWDSPSTEQVTVQVWPAPLARKVVLRRYEGWAEPL